METFRKRPVEVEAVQWDGTAEGARPIIEWIGPAARHTDYTGPAILVQTLEGSMTARSGDWIIKGVKGEFYPCKPDIFAATYE